MKQTAFHRYLAENYRKIIGWGTSKFYEEHAPQLNVDLAYLVDSDPCKWGKHKDDLPICPPAALAEEHPDETLVIVFSSFFDDIHAAMREMGPFHAIRADQIDERLFDKEALLSDKEREGGVVLTVSRSNFATLLNGTAKLIREQMEVFNGRGKTHLHLYWGVYHIKKFHGIFVTAVKNGSRIGIYPLADIFEALSHVELCIIHNLTGMDLETAAQMVDRVPGRANVFYYVHDFSCICGSIKLMHNDETFCQAYAHNWEPCRSCKFAESRKTVHAFHERFFRNERIQLIAPSENAKSIICKAFAIDPSRIRVIPHQRYVLSAPFVKRRRDGRIKIAYVGYKHRHKGWDVFKRVCKTFGSQYDFYCFGESDDRVEGIRYVPVSFIADGERAMTEKLVEYGIDFAFLWSTWPETYSYTYFESFAAGCFVITNRLSGNIADQVIANQNGIVLQDEEELMQLLKEDDRLEKLAGQARPVIRALARNEPAFEEWIDAG